MLNFMQEMIAGSLVAEIFAALWAVVVFVGGALQIWKQIKEWLPTHIKISRAKDGLPKETYLHHKDVDASRLNGFVQAEWFGGEMMPPDIRKEVLSYTNPKPCHGVVVWAWVKLSNLFRRSVPAAAPTEQAK